MEPVTKMVKLSKIHRDGAWSETQVRQDVHDKVIAEYGEHLAKLPPVDLFGDDRLGFWVGDGHHRIAAHAVAGREEIKANVHAGGKREALLFALGANGDH